MVEGGLKKPRIKKCFRFLLAKMFMLKLTYTEIPMLIITSQQARVEVNKKQLAST